MAQNITPDGIAVTNRVEGKTLRALNAKVVDAILTGPTYMSRLMSKAKRFKGSTMDWTIKFQQSSQFEWFTGLENLNSAAEDNEITLSFAHTAGTQPKVSIMTESFANAGEDGIIPLDAYKYEEAAQEVLQQIADAAYSTGAGDAPLGLQAIVDNGTNAATIGGQTKSSYDVLDATYTDSGGTLTLAKLGVLDDAAAKGGKVASVPNINVMDFTRWSLYEQLIDPQLRANYNSAGFPRMSVMGDGPSEAVIGGAAGFASLHHRGFPAIKDKKATAGVWYKLNEDSFGWFGRTIVPEEYKRLGLTKVNLGSMEAMDSLAAKEAPSSFNGWFYQPPMMMPDQAGTIARFYVLGQVCTWRPNLDGQLHSITGV
ncbi:hypothetical protein KKE60_04885 [Patescibacteria group bacterium]|nr:hypothetical protein [Patescibacteria group bacterium]